MSGQNALGTFSFRSIGQPPSLLARFSDTPGSHVDVEVPMEDDTTPSPTNEEVLTSTSVEDPAATGSSTFLNPISHPDPPSSSSPSASSFANGLFFAVSSTSSSSKPSLDLAPVPRQASLTDTMSVDTAQSVAKPSFQAISHSTASAHHTQPRAINTSKSFPAFLHAWPSLASPSQNTHPLPSTAGISGSLTHGYLETLQMLYREQSQWEQLAFLEQRFHEEQEEYVRRREDTRRAMDREREQSDKMMRAADAALALATQLRVPQRRRWEEEQTKVESALRTVSLQSGEGPASVSPLPHSTQAPTALGLPPTGQPAAQHSTQLTERASSEIDRSEPPQSTPMQVIDPRADIEARERELGTQRAQEEVEAGRTHEEAETQRTYEEAELQRKHDAEEAIKRRTQDLTEAVLRKHQEAEDQREQEDEQRKREAEAAEAEARRQHELQEQQAREAEAAKREAEIAAKREAEEAAKREAEEAAAEYKARREAFQAQRLALEEKEREEAKAREAEYKAKRDAFLAEKRAKEDEAVLQRQRELKLREKLEKQKANKQGAKVGGAGSQLSTSQSIGVGSRSSSASVAGMVAQTSQNSETPALATPDPAPATAVPVLPAGKAATARQKSAASATLTLAVKPLPKKMKTESQEVVVKQEPSASPRGEDMELSSSAPPVSSRPSVALPQSSVVQPPKLPPMQAVREQSPQLIVQRVPTLITASPTTSRLPAPSSANLPPKPPIPNPPPVSLVGKQNRAALSNIVTSGFSVRGQDRSGRSQPGKGAGSQTSAHNSPVTPVAAPIALPPAPVPASVPTTQPAPQPSRNLAGSVGYYSQIPDDMGLDSSIGQGVREEYPEYNRERDSVSPVQVNNRRVAPPRMAVDHYSPSPSPPQRMSPHQRQGRPNDQRHLGYSEYNRRASPSPRKRARDASPDRPYSARRRRYSNSSSDYSSPNLRRMPLPIVDRAKTPPGPPPSQRYTAGDFRRAPPHSPPPALVYSMPYYSPPQSYGGPQEVLQPQDYSMANTSTSFSAPSAYSTAYGGPVAPEPPLPSLAYPDSETGQYDEPTPELDFGNHNNLGHHVLRTPETSLASRLGNSPGGKRGKNKKGQNQSGGNRANYNAAQPSNDSSIPLKRPPIRRNKYVANNYKQDNGVNATHGRLPPKRSLGDRLNKDQLLDRIG